MYTDEELIMLSGIQHIAFCERQYALIYIENEWEENYLTIQGHQLHERVDNPYETDKRTDIISLRGVYIYSYSLGLYGKADLVELIQTTEKSGNILLPSTKGYWKVKPVEYKRGKPKADVCDEIQLCAQAMCLEEMYEVTIKEADIFYGKPRRRKSISLDQNLRELTRQYAIKMHQLFIHGITPPPVYLPRCQSCSMLNICQPRVVSRNRSIQHYFDEFLELEL